MSFDRTNPDHLLALKNEANNDPNGYGYDVADTNNLLKKVNKTRNAIIVSKPKISSALVRSTTVYSAYKDLAQDEQEWLIWMTGSNGFEEENLIVTNDVRKKLTATTSPGVSGGNSIWATNDKASMEASMLDIIDIKGSRMEELFGIYTVINKDDWRAARDS